MSFRKAIPLIITVSLLAGICFGQSEKQSSNAEGKPVRPNAEEAASRLRRALPVVPALVRGPDGLLNLNGQRATQNQLVTSTNVKDPVTDAFPLTAGLPVEAGEPTHVPPEQFTVTLPKFYATVPVLNQLRTNGWHATAGVPFFAFKHTPDGVRGLRSLAPIASVSGPAAGGKLLFFQSADYRLSKTTLRNLEHGDVNDVKYQSYDLNTHAEVKAGRRHTLSARLALFSQEVDNAGLNAFIPLEATPDYLMRGGQISFSDAFAPSSHTLVSSSLSLRKLRLRVLPKGAEPMELIEQGEVEGNYFDTLRRNASRFEWREAVRAPEWKGWGRHQMSFGGGVARSAFDSVHLGNTIILLGHDDDELTSITNFGGSPFESLAVEELTGWYEDRWSPHSRVSLTMGLKYDWTTLSRTNQWAPRFGFALLPQGGDRTVIRGGIGVFYDIMPMSVGTFTRGRQRIIQFFEDGAPLGEPRLFANTLSRPHLRTSSVRAWNLEVDRQVGSSLFLRAKIEDRRARNLPLLTPNRPGSQATGFVLSDGGSARYREFEATASYRPVRRGVLNATYVRSSSVGDLSTFGSVMGTFEKLYVPGNRYALSRTDSPHRFLAWGDVDAVWGVTVLPALDVHTGFPFAFIDASSSVAPEADFARYPRVASLDLSLRRDFNLGSAANGKKLRLGVTIFNLTNHFNPRDADTTEDENEERPVLRGFLNGAGRSYRVSAVFNF